ncbi:MAG: hypothetical protein WCT14_11420 [Treponemataceae bacterium]
MKKKAGVILCLIGILFLINAIFGRYIVLPGYFQSLEAGASASRLPESVPVLKVLRYLLWAFSFKLGVYFFILGAMYYHDKKLYERISFLVIGLLYISVAYMELPFTNSLFFGVGGGILTLLFLFLFATINEHKSKNITHGIPLFLNLGYFFLAMAVYNLCPFCGVKCFALQPEKMIKYGLQNQAVSFANHIMIELVFGFAFLCVYYLTANKKKET